jgi:hypothetical protein
MKIIHHVNVHSSSAEFYSYIIRSGIQYTISDYPGNDNKLLSFDISETDPLWETVFALLKKYQGFDIYRGGDIYDTFFSDDEIRQADWLRIVSTFEQGYPQPAGNWPLKQSSFSIICPSCVIYEQINPMRISKEPNIRKNSFMSLIGAGELFAVPEVFSEINSIGATGYETREVLIHKTNQPSEKVQQLYIPAIAKPGLLGTEEMRQVHCQKCGTVKYYPHKRGIMRLQKNALELDTDFVKTYEWFGLGLISYKEIIVSNRVASFILEKGWKGIRFKVVELV